MQDKALMIALSHVQDQHRAQKVSWCVTHINNKILVARSDINIVLFSTTF